MDANANERMAILKMVEDKKVTPEQAAQLLTALGQNKPTSAAASGSAPVKKDRRFLRVRVTIISTDKPKTSVTVPFSLVDWGLRVGAQFSPEVAGLDLTELGEILKSNAEGKIVDVMDEEDDEHVEIFVE